jgi:hypothetical protein
MGPLVQAGVSFTILLKDTLVSSTFNANDTEFVKSTPLPVFTCA